jgi:hypothetical protein
MACQLLCAVLVTLLLGGSILGCSGSPVAPTPEPSPATRIPPKASPSTQPDPSTPQYWTISGTVWLYTENGAVPSFGGQVSGWVEHNHGAYSSSAEISATGRYELRVATDTTWVSLAGPGFQPCAVAFSPKGNSTADINLVVDPLGLVANLPPGLMLNAPTLSGTVYEQTPSGRRPIGGARVGLDGLNGDGVVIANTLTDAAGRYVLCGVPQRERTALFVETPGVVRVFQFDDFGGKSTFDIEMVLSTD